MEFIEHPTFWVAIAFVIFVVLTYKPIRKATISALDAKIDSIRNDVEEAQRLREEAQAMLASYQRQQREATQEIEALMDRARAEAEAHAKASAEALAAALARQEQQARENIAHAETVAVQEIRNRAVSVAIAAATRLLEEKLAGDVGDALVARSIEALPERLH